MITVHSYGALHNPGHAEPLPEFTATFDLRRQLRDPHHDPAFRQLTGLDQRVAERVMTQPGAWPLVHSIASVALRLELPDEETILGLFCQDGRHRSVVVADEVFNVLSNLGADVGVKHLDITKPVVERPKEVTA
jgi:RNase adaptor protein for sRNA GlmZ degradation